VSSQTLRRRCAVTACLFVLLVCHQNFARRRPPAGGRIAVVIDERLAALRVSPQLSSALVRRVSRGTLVAIRGERRGREGVFFYKVSLSSRTSGWMQREALATSSRAGDDARLLKLINGSQDFDRIARARIFLDNFGNSNLRPQVLLIFCQTAEEVASHLTREALRRLDSNEMMAGGAPLFSYFLNFSGLDRYNRQGVTFIYDAREKTLRYDGEGWQELVHHYPKSPEAAEARKHLESRSAMIWP